MVTYFAILKTSYVKETNRQSIHFFMTNIIAAVSENVILKNKTDVYGSIKTSISIGRLTFEMEIMHKSRVRCGDGRALPQHRRHGSEAIRYRSKYVS